jgi:hypothetical protein
MATAICLVTTAIWQADSWDQLPDDRSYMSNEFSVQSVEIWKERVVFCLDLPSTWEERQQQTSLDTRKLNQISQVLPPLPLSVAAPTT